MPLPTFAPPSPFSCAARGMEVLCHVASRHNNNKNKRVQVRKY